MVTDPPLLTSFQAIVTSPVFAEVAEIFCGLKSGRLLTGMTVTVPFDTVPRTLDASV